MPHTQLQELNYLLENQFKGITLKKPLFYNADFGLRFNLQNGNVGSAEYFEECIRRAQLIFNSVFNQNDVIHLVISKNSSYRQRIKSGHYVLRQINNLNDLSFFKQKNIYLENTSRRFAVVKTVVREVNTENIFRKISYSDFPQDKSAATRAWKDTEVYFIEMNKGIILNMYDDRGLDIIAHEKETLRKIYEEQKSLILDFDRENIDFLFSPD